ncbi:MAG: prolipoprotein diacylglyceryl transferase [Candidatus Omnitrophica bacterium CG11_big_fil_rev_8_21_14_0_20_63_9]|nr:MAG: prolipoprotein diacylglyceryl transferase [Candidatus Omnitrophica bacterium CG11_big_fil_rev_8_21_14_0_20_63_9]
MHPILLKLGPFTLYTYGAMLVLAFAVSTWLGARTARQLPQELVAITSDQLLDFTAVLLFGGLFGARFLYVVLRWEEFAAAPQHIIALWEGGLVWYGGFAGGVLASWLYVRSHRLSWLRVADQVVPFLALGHAIGRIGCFLNGCCYGKPVDGCCGVLFPGHQTPVVPTQLLESLGLFAIYLWLRGRQPGILRSPGRSFGGYLLLYGLLRFGIEYLRGDQTAWWMGLTLQQLISLGMLLVGGTLWFQVSGFKFLVNPPNKKPETRNQKR